MELGETVQVYLPTVVVLEVLHAPGRESGCVKTLVVKAPCPACACRFPCRAVDAEFETFGLDVFGELAHAGVPSWKVAGRLNVTSGVALPFRPEIVGIHVNVTSACKPKLHQPVCCVA